MDNYMIKRIKEIEGISMGAIYNRGYPRFQNPLETDFSKLLNIPSRMTLDTMIDSMNRTEKINENSIITRIEEVEKNVTQTPLNPIEDLRKKAELTLKRLYDARSGMNY